MSIPRISVIVPAKDQQDFLSDTLTSLTLQFEDPAELEVVVVCDGSTDATEQVALDHAKAFENFTLLVNDHPHGLARARNEGIDAARGKYIGFLDGDDWYTRGFLPGALDTLDRLDVDFVRFDHIQAVGGNRTISRAPQAVRGVTLDPKQSVVPLDKTTMIDYPYSSAGIYHRRLIDRGLLHFPIPVHTAEDRPWIWQLFLQADSYAIHDNLGFVYRRGISTSLTQIMDDRQLDFARAYACAYELNSSVLDLHPQFQVKMALQYLAIAYHHLNRCRSTKAPNTSKFVAAVSEGLQAFPATALTEASTRLGRKRMALLHDMVPAISLSEVAS